VQGGCFVFWRLVKILLRLFVIRAGLFSTEFEPMGWRTRLIWGSGENPRIPRWIAGTFYEFWSGVGLFGPWLAVAAT